MAADEAPSAGVSKWQLGLAVAGATAAAAAGYLYYRRRKGEPEEGSAEGGSESPSTSSVTASSEAGKGGSDAGASDAQASSTSSQAKGASMKLSDESLLERALSMKNKGNKYFKAASYDAAIRSYQEAIDVCPIRHSSDMAAFHQNIAACYEQLAMRAAAEEEKTEHLRTVVDRCTVALNLNERYLKAFIRRSRAYQLLGEYEKALEDVTAGSIMDNLSGGGGMAAAGGMSQNIMMLANQILRELGKAKAAEFCAKRPPKAPSAAYIKSYLESYQYDALTLYDVDEPQDAKGDDSAHEQTESAVSDNAEQTAKGDTEGAAESASSPGDGKDVSSAAEVTEKDAETSNGDTANGETDAPTAEDESVAPPAEEGEKEIPASEPASQSEPAPAEEEAAVPNGISGNKHAKYCEVVDVFRAQKFEDAQQLCQDVLDGDTITERQRGHMLVILATIHQLYSRTAKAMATLNQLIDMPEKSVPLEVRVNALVKRGSQHLISGNPDEALADFQMAHGLAPTNPDVFHHRGQMHFLLDRLPEAIADYQQCAAVSPTFPAAQVQLQYAKYKMALMGQSEMAMKEVVTSFEEIFKRFPTYVEGLSLFAQVLQDQGDLERSEKLYQKAMELEPNNGSLYVHHGLLLLSKNSSFDEALAEMERALEVDSDCDFAYETMATMEIQRGHVRKAIDLWDKALELCRTEIEMAHLFSLREAAQAQERVSKRLGLQMNPFPGMNPMVNA